MPRTVVALRNAQDNLRAGRFEAAVQTYAEVLENEPENLDALAGMGSLALIFQDVEKATQFAVTALDLDEEHVPSVLLLGSCWQALNRWPEAEIVFEEAVRLAPNSADAHYRLGCTQILESKPDEAIEHLNQAITLNPKNARPYWALAEVYEQREQWSDAVQTYHACIKACPDRPEAYAHLIALLAQEDQIPAAQSVLREALKLFPEEANIHRSASFLARAQGDAEAAHQALVEAARLDPGHEETVIQAARFELQRDDLQAAASHLDGLIERNPDSHRGLHLRATLYRTIGAFDEAINDLRDAINIDPSHWEYQNDLGMLLLEQGVSESRAECREEAVAVLELAVSMAPADAAQPRYALARAYQATDRAEKARTLSDELLKRLPEAAPLYAPTQELAQELAGA